jgi:hypothetical protein
MSLIPASLALLSDNLSSSVSGSYSHSGSIYEYRTYNDRRAIIYKYWTHNDRRAIIYEYWTRNDRWAIILGLR